MQKYIFQDRVQDSAFRLSGYSFSNWHLKLPIANGDELYHDTNLEITKNGVS